MKAAIVHEVRILDPRTIDGYAVAAARCMQANSPEIHGREFSYSGSSDPFTDYFGPKLLVEGRPKPLFLPEGPNQRNPSGYSGLIKLDQFGKIRRGAELGSLFYPAAFSLLERLNIRGILNLYPFTNPAFRVPVYTLQGLRKFIELEPYLPLSFDAVINPTIPLGANRIQIRINPFTAIYAATDESATEDNDQGLMAIHLTAGFTSPKSAILGLKGLTKVFPDSVFEEKLLVGNLPRRISEMYKKIGDFIGAYWDYAGGLGGKKPGLEGITYWEMTSLAGRAHIEFLKPTFERLGIHPLGIDYHDDVSNMHYSTSIENFDDVIRLISRGYYDGLRIPTIHATFNGQEIAVEFPSWEPESGSTFAMQVRNASNNSHTLEFILAGIQSRFPRK